MGSPTSLLAGARAFARDFARDGMPKGYLWDCVDYVPSIIDAMLTGRGGWRWGSPNMLSGDVESGIFAPYVDGEQLLFQTDTGRLMRVNDDPPYNLIGDRGAIPRSLQNPVFRRNEAIWFDRSGAVGPTLVRSGGIFPSVTSATAPYIPAPHAKVGCNASKYLAVSTGDDAVWFSHPTNDLAGAQGWDEKSFISTGGSVTALAALRSVLIVFHAGYTERIRGATPPNSTIANSDMAVEPLFVRVGCPDPRAIAYWNENVIFADEHGVHITDGAVIRNLASQGGISSYWRPLFQGRTSISATTFLDYYQVTIGQTTGGPITLVCDLNKRQWFRFSNVDALCYVAGGGLDGMERVWAGIRGSQSVARIGPMYFPAPLGQTTDDNGQPVLPDFQTPWYSLGEEGRKRIRFAYLSYDVRSDASLEGGVASKQDIPGPTEITPLSTGPVLELSYIRSPQDLTYTALGQLPFTTARQRYRLPLGQFSYGVAFRLRQVNASTVTRVFDLAVESQAAERSRV